MRIKNNKIDRNKIIVSISIIIFLVSLTQNSYCSSNGFCNNTGITSMLFGPLGIFMLHLPAFTWLANPLLFISWFLSKSKPKKAFVFNLLSFILMLSFLFVEEIINNEAGTKYKIASLGAGYYLWLSSSFFLLIANFINLKKKNV